MSDNFFIIGIAIIIASAIVCSYLREYIINKSEEEDDE